MKQLLYVYVPGFEYDSKGPLHIDAIRLNVTVGENKSDSTDNSSNVLLTYCYIGGSGATIPGNVIYRLENLNSDNRIELYYQGNSHLSPVWTKIDRYGRVPHGFFNDFITTDEESETTHHVIGIHNSPYNCLNLVSNFNAEEHDGLFAIELEKLDTDLILNFTFYSKIDDSSVELNNKITVGKISMAPYDTSTIEQFTYDNIENFGDKYVEIGKWTQTYNPAIGDLTETTTTESSGIPQYFNFKNSNWGTNDQNWEIPVNGEMLVTDTGLSDISSHNSFYKQLSYDPNTLLHYLDPNLTCNATDYGTDPEKFYTNFYRGFYNYHHTDYTKDICKRGGAWCERKSSNYYDRLYMCYVLFNPTISLQYSYSYKLCYVNTDSLEYLYTNSPKISVKELSQDPEVGNDLWNVKSLFSLNTHTCTVEDIAILNVPRIYNLAHFQNTNHDINYTGGNHKFTYCVEKPTAENYNGIWQNVRENKPAVSNSTINVSFSETLPGEQPVKISENKTITLGRGFNNEDTCKALRQQYTNSRSLLPSAPVYANNSTVYVGKFTNEDFNRNCVLSDGQLDIALTKNNLLKFDINVNKLFFPAILFGGAMNNYAIGYNAICKYFDGVNNGVNDNLQVPTWPYYGGGEDTGYIVYNYQNYLNTNKIGQIDFGLSLMFQIDLKDSNIRYNNIGDYNIIPTVVSNKGYVLDLSSDQKRLINPTVKTTNLLIDSNSNDPELCQLLNNECLFCTNLISGRKGGIHKFDTTFAIEKRFIGVTDINASEKDLILNKTVSLEKGFYVLRVQTLYPDTNNDRISLTYKLGEDTTEHTVYGICGRFMFNVVDEHINLTLVKLHINFLIDRIFDVVSGIGLYKADTDSVDTVAQALKQAIDNITETKYIADNTLSRNIIFPAIYCAKENIIVCDRLYKYRHQAGMAGADINRPKYKADYLNDYCTSKDNDPLYHYYNFSYLPDKAVYEVAAFYTIPSKKGANTPSSVEQWDGMDNKDLELIKNKIIRVRISHE